MLRPVENLNKTWAEKCCCILLFRWQCCVQLWRCVGHKFNKFLLMDAFTEPVNAIKKERSKKHSTTSAYVLWLQDFDVKLMEGRIRVLKSDQPTFSVFVCLSINTWLFSDTCSAQSLFAHLFSLLIFIIGLTPNFLQSLL